jgi:hypothetical protein
MCVLAGRENHYQSDMVNVSLHCLRVKVIDKKQLNL